MLRKGPQPEYIMAVLEKYTFLFVSKTYHSGMAWGWGGVRSGDLANLELGDLDHRLTGVLSSKHANQSVRHVLKALVDVLLVLDFTLKKNSNVLKKYTTQFPLKELSCTNVLENGQFPVLTSLSQAYIWSRASGKRSRQRLTTKPSIFSCLKTMEPWTTGAKNKN